MPEVAEVRELGKEKANNALLTPRPLRQICSSLMSPHHWRPRFYADSNLPILSICAMLAPAEIVGFKMGLALVIIVVTPGP